MVIPEKEPQSLCGRSTRTGIHHDTETVISAITSNKISCYLSAGYSTRVHYSANALPSVNRYRYIKDKKHCSPDKIFWEQFPALSTAISYFIETSLWRLWLPQFAIICLKKHRERSKKIPDRNYRVVLIAGGGQEKGQALSSPWFSTGFLSYYEIWTFIRWIRGKFILLIITLISWILVNWNIKYSSEKKIRWARWDSNSGPPPCQGDVIAN